MIGRALRAGALLAALSVAGCAAGGGSAPSVAAPASGGAGATAGPSVGEARAAIESALGARSIQLQDPPIPYRPAEPPAVAALPRAVYQAILPDDPGHGYIVVYDLPDLALAQAAAEAQAAYVGSPVGRVQFPFGTRFVIRRLGPTVIFYADPPESPDDQAPDVAEALRTVGTEVSVPS